MKKFNYAVGSYWKERYNNTEDGIGCYAIGTEVHYGTMKQAKDYLKYVKKQKDGVNYKIFMLVELPDE